MKCQNCNMENFEYARFCTNCGNPLVAPQPPVYTQPAPQSAIPTSPEPILVNPAKNRLIAVANDPLYLALCIALTAWSVIGGFAVAQTLIAIFSWLCFANAKKNNIEYKHLRVISGAVYTIYIVAKILAILFIILGSIMTVVFIVTGAIGNMDNSIYNSVPFELKDFFYRMPVNFIWAMGIAVGVGLILGGVAVLVTNKLGMKKIHGFAKSVYKSVESGTENYEKPKYVCGWLIAYSATYAASTIYTYLYTIITSRTISISSNSIITSTLCLGACIGAGIIAFLLVKKYFVDSQK